MTRAARVLAGLVAIGLGAAFTALVDETPVRAQDDKPGSVEEGARLYEAGCATCHGADGTGVGPWPSIVNAGEAGADFQLRTGRMPFTGEPDEQAQRKPPAYDEAEIRDLVAFVASLGDGPAIPDVAVDEELLAEGQRLFAVNCAPCHGATANGGAVGENAIAPPLLGSDPVTVGEAMVHGPGQMPVFPWPDDDLDAVVTYVEYLRTAPDPGGFAIGGIGPVPEGLVAWFMGMGLLVLIVVLVGRSWERASKERP